MAALPALSTDQPPVPSATAKPPGPVSAPAEPSAVSRSGRVVAGLFAALAGLVALFALAAVYVDPALTPILAPLAVVLGALSLWGASRIDHRRMRDEVAALSADKRELSASLERIADTAWELRESEERYRDLIDAQGDLVVHRATDGRVTFANPAFFQAFGVDAAGIIGAPLTLTPLETVSSRDGAATRGDVEARDIKLMTASGPRWFAWVDIKIRDDDGALGPVYSVARDITARKEVELALVGARKRAEAASQSKSRFLATVSHEFRTPLNGILGLNGLLLETRLSPVQETYARGVQSSGEALLGLIDDMLDFSKIEAGRIDLRPAPTDLQALLQDIVELLAARAHGKQIDIVADIDPAIPEQVRVDAIRLRQVLVNLVANGVKFTTTGGVALAAELVTVDDGMATIAFSVSDSGPGIAPEDIDRLFEEFEQVDNAPDRLHGGVGLGLAISRRIVRRMASDLTVAPREGGGSVFRFALRLPTDGPARPVPTEVAGRRFLIAMPGGAEPDVLARALDRAGAETRQVRTLHAANALIAAAAAAGLPYDAVLVGRDLVPDLAAAGTSLGEAAGGKICTVLLIEPGDRHEIDALRQAGFDAYLVRPIRRSSLIRIVSQLGAIPGVFHIDPEDAEAETALVAEPRSTFDVLLAEDNEISALLARAVIEGLGHRVVEVHDGDAAIAAATGGTTPFALILLDIHMPGRDGLAAARAIRRHESDSGAPRARIVALTADVLPETEAEARAAGIDSVLSKPISPESLRQVLVPPDDPAP